MLEAAKNALFGGANQYPPGPGRPELRAAIARHRLRYGTEYDPDTEILVTAGATEAIAAALLALTEPGDEVIVIEPYYDSYAAAVAMAGAERRVVGLVEGPDGRFGLDVDGAARRRHAADPGDPGQLAAQPDRHRVHPRRAGGAGRAVRRARPDRDLRRGLRAPGLRRRASTSRWSRCPACGRGR